MLRLSLDCHTAQTRRWYNGEEDSIFFLYLMTCMQHVVTNEQCWQHSLQFLQLSRPPSLPPIFEMARPELKLAGVRIDPELFSGSKKGYSIDMAIVDADQVTRLTRQYSSE